MQKRIYACIKIHRMGWAPVAHACNPSYLGAEMRRIAAQSQTWANSLPDAIFKKPTQKVLEEWLKV
jgi:hypothetical protein